MSLHRFGGRTSDALVGDELAAEIEFTPKSGVSMRKQLLGTVTESSSERPLELRSNFETAYYFE